MYVDFDKMQGLVPVVVQHALNMKVLMLGYMNSQALAKTLELGKLCFYSRSRQKLWVKGETSGNFLMLQELKVDCDKDTLLAMAIPTGPVCHTGSSDCFNSETGGKAFLYELEETIDKRRSRSSDTSYTRLLFDKGINKIAQKLGEEAVELIIEAKDDNDNAFKNEAADLMFHFLVMLAHRGLKLEDIETVLKQRSLKSEREAAK